MFSLFSKKSLKGSSQSEMSPWDAVALERLVSGLGRSDLRILEIGSWFGGGSTSILQKYAQRLVCVDHWQGNENDTHRELAATTDPYAIFRGNIKRFSEKVIAVHSNSKDALELFGDETFDVVFIDGDHRYEQTCIDIASSKRLLTAGGILCGHDCEGRPTAENERFLLDNAHRDHCESIFENFREMHPGVILAVAELVDKAVLFGEQRFDINLNGRAVNGCSSIWYKKYR